MRKSVFYSLLFILVSLILRINEIGIGLGQKYFISNTLDLSWQTDIVERLLHGFILGRDFVFSYGPIFQILYSLPSIIFGIPSYQAIIFAPIITTFLSALIILFISKLFFEKEFDFVFPFFLFFIVGLFGYTANDTLRLLLPIFYTLLVYRLAKTQDRRQYVFISSLPSVFGLYSYDIFVYCLFLSIILLAVDIFFFKKNIRLMPEYILYLTLVILWQVGFSILLSGGFGYIASYLDGVISYARIMRSSWFFDQNYLLVFLGLAPILFFLYIRHEKAQIDIKRKILFLLICAAVLFNTALIRSDSGHIYNGLYPAIIVTSFLVYLLTKLDRQYLLFAVILYLLLPHRVIIKNFRPANFKIVAQSLITEKEFANLYKVSDSYYFTAGDFENFKNIVIENPGEVFVYPYDNYILNLHGQTYNSYALQLYMYNNSLVEDKTVQKLKENPPEYIIMGIEGVSAVVLDGIPHSVRNPIFNQWMRENYEEYERQQNYVILKLKDSLM